MKKGKLSKLENGVIYIKAGLSYEKVKEKIVKHIKTIKRDKQNQRRWSYTYIWFSGMRKYRTKQWRFGSARS
ncbi:hypothetical protein CFF27374_08510 [Campylobacter fetus subsp. fetus]|nr:hypothetical protein CFF27374_08510 [Campylobacter fetus subsp. fetus]